MKNIPILVQVKIILKRWRWCGVEDFIHIGLSYRNRISEWNQTLAEKNHPICIASKKGKESTFRYKLARRQDCQLIPMQSGSRYMIREGTPSAQEINLLTQV